MVDGAGDVAVGGGRVAGVDLAVDQQRPDQRQRGDPGDRQAGDREAEAPAARRCPLASAARRRELARSGRRPGRRAARKKIAPSAAISQNQSIAAPTAKARQAASSDRVQLPLRPAGGAPGGEPGPQQRPDQRQHQQAADQPQLGEGLEVERVGVEDRRSGSSAAGPRRTGRCRRRGRARGFSPKASIATRQNSLRPAPESSLKCSRGWFGNCRSELENWSQARPPTAIAAPIASSAATSGDPLQHAAGRARAPRARPVSAALAALQPAQAGEQRQRQRHPGEQDQQHRHAPGRPSPGRRCCRRGCAAPAPPAPPAAPRARRSPASPAARAGRGRGRAGSRGDQQRQQAAARVGEVERQQQRPAARPTASQRRPAFSERRLIHSSIADADPEDEAVGVPVAERIAQPRAAAEAGSERRRRRAGGGWPGPANAISDQGNCDAFSETLAPLVGLGDEECGKEEPEVDQNAVRLGDAQLDRPRPER